MKNLLSILFFFLALTVSSIAQTVVKYQDYASQGGKSATVQGSNSSNKFAQVYPSCTVTVYLTGTTTLAPLYSDTLLTSKSNPFTATSEGYYEFFAIPGQYDIRISGTGVTTPFTRSRVELQIGQANVLGGTVDYLQLKSSSSALGDSPIYKSGGVVHGATAGSGTNTTQLATTAFVQQEVPTATITAKGKATLGKRAYIATSGDRPTCSSSYVDQTINKGYGNRAPETCREVSTGVYQWIDEDGGRVNVRRFGAKGDGSTDDTTAIQAAAAIVNSAGSGFSVLYFPPHNAGQYYKTTAAIQISRAGVEIVGDGATDSAVVNTTSGVNIFEIGDGATQITEVKIRYLSIQGGDNSDWAVYARKAPNLTISDCTISNSSTAEGAVYLSESWNSRIENCTIGSIKGTGIYTINSTNSLAITGVRIDGIGAAGVGSGVYITGNNTVFTGSTIQGIGKLGDLIGRGISFNTCYFESYDSAFLCGSFAVAVAFRECYASPHVSTDYFIDAPNGVTGLQVEGLFIDGDHATSVLRLGASASKVVLSGIIKQATLAPPASIYTGSVPVSEVVYLPDLPVRESTSTHGFSNASGGHKVKVYGNSGKTEWLEMDFTSSSLYLATNKSGGGSYRNMYIGPYGGSVKLGFLYAGSAVLEIGSSGLNPTAAGGQNLGTSALPFQYLYVSGSSPSPGSNNFRLGGTATGSRTLDLPDASGTLALRLSGSGLLDYATASANTCETLTLTVTGAVDDDAVSLGVPHALSNHNTTATFFGWVSASNTVSVRRCVIAADGSDPAKGTVTVKIVR